MITIVVFLSVVIYFTEIIKYYIGIICFFKAAMKRRWVIIPFVLLDLTVALIHGFNESGVYMTPYLLAGVTAFFMMDKKMGVRICQVLGIFFITSGTDEIMGIILSYVLPVTWRNTAALSILEGILTICILFFIGKIKSRIKRGVSNSVNRSAIILAFCMLFCIILTITGLEAAKVYVPSHNLRLGFDIICIAAYLCMIGLVAFVFYIHEINKKLAISLKLQECRVNQECMTGIIIGYSAIQMLAPIVLNKMSKIRSNAVKIIPTVIVIDLLFMALCLTNNLAVLIPMLLLPSFLCIISFLTSELQNNFIDTIEGDEHRATILSVFSMGTNLFDIAFLGISGFLSKQGTSIPFLVAGNVTLLIGFIFAAYSRNWKADTSFDKG